jgi:hypothetical protein
MMSSRSGNIRELFALRIRAERGLADFEKARILRKLDSAEVADRLVSLLRGEASPGTQAPAILRARANTLRREIAAELGEENLKGGSPAASYWARQLDELRFSALNQYGRGTIESNMQFLLDLGARYPSHIPLADVPRYRSWSPSMLALQLHKQGVVGLLLESSSKNILAVRLTRKGVALVGIVSIYVEAYSPADEESP